MLQSCITFSPACSSLWCFHVRRQMNRPDSDPKLQLTTRGDGRLELTYPLSFFPLVHPGLVLTLTNPSLQTWPTSVLLTTALSAPDKPIKLHPPIKTRTRMNSLPRYMALCVLLAAVALLVLPAAAEVTLGQTYSGDGTYYGYRTRGFGHCSFHFHGFGTSQGYVGTPLAINAKQYTGTSICGQCVKYRGVGRGLGGNPVPGDWQPGFICDQCPECSFGDIDMQKGGDGRWKVEWFPVQCPVGSSTFRFGYQGGNPWYRKMMVANARVPVRNVQISVGGSWSPLTKTIDNYWEFHGDTSKAWSPCANVRITSILGDTVEDSVCCSSGTCTGKSQFPCKSSLPSDDCGGSSQPTQINVGGIGQAGQGSGSVAQEAAAKAQSFGRADLAAARVPQVKTVQKGATCGDKNGKWADTKCENSECKQKGTWWGCM